MRDPVKLTEAELSYLAGQRLGRLATVDPHGAPQNSPVGFKVNTELGTIDIRGLRMSRSRKFRNIRTNPAVAFVVDDIFSTAPWRVRCVEIRGTAEAVEVPPSRGGFDSGLIRITPTRVISFGL